MMTGTGNGETVTAPSLPTLRPSQMVVIVPREQAEKFEALTNEFAGVPGCRVILDRRVADRRRQQGAWESTERRHRDRRTGDLEQASSFAIVVC